MRCAWTGSRSPGPYRRIAGMDWGRGKALICTCCAIMHSMCQFGFRSCCASLRDRRSIFAAFDRAPCRVSALPGDDQHGGAALARLGNKREGLWTRSFPLLSRSLGRGLFADPPALSPLSLPGGRRSRARFAPLRGAASSAQQPCRALGSPPRRPFALRRARAPSFVKMRARGRRLSP